MADKKNKIKEVVERTKEKLGELKTKNVKPVKKLKPKKGKKDKKDKVKESKHKTGAIAYGPKGGQYKITPTGKKEYVKKALDEWKQQSERIEEFLKNFKSSKEKQD
jgi:gas vesicle protein